MSESLERYVLNNAVASKLSGRPVVGRYEGRTLVFVHGFPMSLAGFYMISTKAIFGASIHLSARRWQELHAETLLLCRGLSVELRAGREAFSVLMGVRQAMQWSKDTFDKEKIIKWVEEVEQDIAQLG